MKKLHWNLMAGLLLSATQLAQAAPDFFRFQPGSVRVYRAQNSESTFTIRVGSVGFMHNDHTHYQVTGYANQPLRLYRNEQTGALYHLDPDTDQDVLLTSIEKGPGWFHAPYRMCDQEGHPENDPSTYWGPAGYFNNDLTISYRAYGCNDTGIESEQFVENIGMVQRTVQTFRGPLQYDLVYASIGTTIITEAPSSTFSINARRAFGPAMLVDLHYDSNGQGRVLQFGSSQDYEVVLRNAKGEEIWRWSNGQFFTPSLRNVSQRQLNFTVEVPLQIYGILLHEGVYTIEAWLTTTPERQFASSIQFTYEHPPIPGEQE